MLYYEGAYEKYSLTKKYFLNKFYKQAMLLKAKKLLFKKYQQASYGAKSIKEETAKKDLLEISTFINNLEKRAYQETDLETKNKEEMEKIKKLFGNFDDDDN